MKKIIKINPADNVAVAVSGEIIPGTIFEGVSATEPIPQGHKIALRSIKEGEAVIKYGFPIGHATRDIAAGQWVHSHNLATSLGDNLNYDYSPVETSPFVVDFSCRTINGFLRSNGEMGIRNELWIIPTVGCVNSQALKIAEKLREQSPVGAIDDIRAFTHNYGCSQLGGDHENTRNALASLARHPNAGGVIVLGLGCENNQIDQLRESIGQYDPDRVKFIVSQEVDDEIEEGVKEGLELISRMRSDRRSPQPLSKLRVGLKCGGSDGLSGITANPLVGRFSDWLVGCGGTTVLTEVPEMFGAETMLMNRAKNKEIFTKEVEMINGFKDYFRAYGQPIYENPSPGNKKGGITTLEEKSLGCVQKGGKSEVVDVLCYASPLKTAGLNLLTGPGNDLVASTALALAGCQLVLFTTGRGTPFGTFVPTLKISTNSEIAQRKSKWIDFNAGSIIEGETWDEATHRLIEEVIETVNGKKLNNEISGAKEIAIFKSGVTL